MKNKFLTSILFVGFALLFSSCAKVPQAELDAAKAAVELARTQGADLYLAAEYSALQDSLNAVTEAIEAQKGKMFGNFGDVKTRLASISEQSVAVTAQTETRKAEVLAEVTAMLADLNNTITASKELLSSAPKGKEGAAALEAITAEIAAVEVVAMEAAALMEQGSLLEALDKTKTAFEKITSVKVELEAVHAKVGRRR